MNSVDFAFFIVVRDFLCLILYHLMTVNWPSTCAVKKLLTHALTHGINSGEIGSLSDICIAYTVISCYLVKSIRSAKTFLDHCSTINNFSQLSSAISRCETVGWLVVC